MTFQAVGPLWAGLAAALGVLLLHFLARRRPRPVSLPTARFVPERAVRAPALNRRPSDLRLLALRMAAVLLLGAALARPALPEPHRPVLDLAVADTAASLSAAFAAAFQQAAAQRSAFDSVALTIRSPFTRDRWDAATAAWRRAWPGGIRLEHTSAPAGQPAEVVWPSLPGGDTLRAVVLGDIAAVGRWGRGALPPGTPVAFFNDGRPAAVEVPSGRGCVRHVAIGVPPDDSRLRPAFRRIEERLRVAPCGAVRADGASLDSVTLASLRGPERAAAMADVPSAPRRVPPSMLLFALGVLALASEQAIRRRAP